MATLVVAGAMLQCTGGSGNGVLQVAGSHQVNGGGKVVATVANKSFQIPSCHAQGIPTTCVPNIPGGWSGSSSVLAGGMPVLTSASKCTCGRGGMVSVVSPGQTTISAG